MNPPEAPDISPPPGPIKRIFIFLAGGNPSLFTKVPAGEGDDFAFLGLVVLIPALQALTAGTFTLKTYQNEKGASILTPLAFGIVWALVVLVLDIVVMRQLTKNAPPQRKRTPRPRTPAPGPGVPRRPQEPVHEEYLEPHKPGSRWPAITMRLMFTLVLGALMSHCLLLAIFDKDITQRMHATRTADWKRVEKNLPDTTRDQADLAKASSIRAVTNDVDLIEKYRGYRENQSERTTSENGAEPPSKSLAIPLLSTTKAVSTVPSAPTSSAVGAEEVFLRHKEEVETEVKTQEADVKKKSDDYLDRVKRFEQWSRDIKKAEQMLSYERVGKESKDFLFESIEFKELGRSTSNIEGQGVRCRRIQEFIDTWKPKLIVEDQDVKTDKASLVKAQANLEIFQTESRNQIREEQQQLREARLKGQEVSAGRLKETADEARKSLDAEITRLTKKIDDNNAERIKQQLAFRGDDSDIGEKTNAFEQLLFGIGETDSQQRGRGMFLMVAAGVGLGLFLLDLSPVIFKSLREPGVYERVRQMQADYDPLLAAQTVVAAPPEDDPMSMYASGPIPPRTPPPSRPRHF